MSQAGDFLAVLDDFVMPVGNPSYFGFVAQVKERAMGASVASDLASAGVTEIILDHTVDFNMTNPASGYCKLVDIEGGTEIIKYSGNNFEDAKLTITARGASGTSAAAFVTGDSAFVHPRQSEKLVDVWMPALTAFASASTASAEMFSTPIASSVDNFALLPNVPLLGSVSSLLSLGTRDDLSTAEQVKIEVISTGQMVITDVMTSTPPKIQRNEFASNVYDIAFTASHTPASADNDYLTLLDETSTADSPIYRGTAGVASATIAATARYARTAAGEISSATVSASARYARTLSTGVRVASATVATKAATATSLVGSVASATIGATARYARSSPPSASATIAASAHKLLDRTTTKVGSATKASTANYLINNPTLVGSATIASTARFARTLSTGVRVASSTRASTASFLLGSVASATVAATSRFSRALSTGVRVASASRSSSAANVTTRVASSTISSSAHKLIDKTTTKVGSATKASTANYLINNPTSVGSATIAASSRYARTLSTGVRVASATRASTATSLLGSVASATIAATARFSRALGGSVASATIAASSRFSRALSTAVRVASASKSSSAVNATTRVASATTSSSAHKLLDRTTTKVGSASVATNVSVGTRVASSTRASTATSLLGSVASATIGATARYARALGGSVASATVAATARYTRREREAVRKITAGLIWTNMPKAQTELGGANAYWNNVIDMSGRPYNQCRLVGSVSTVGSAAGKVWGQFSNDGTNWFDLGNDAVETPVVNSIQTAGFKDSGWITMITAASGANCRLRCSGKGGNGALDPEFRNLQLMFRRA